MKHTRHKHHLLADLIQANISPFAKAHNQRAQRGLGDGAAGKGHSRQAGQARMDRRQHAVCRSGVLGAEELVEAVKVGQRAGRQRNLIGGGHGAMGSLARRADHLRRASSVWPSPSLSKSARRASAMRSSASGIKGVGVVWFMLKR